MPGIPNARALTQTESDASETRGGLLTRRSLNARTMIHVGKEANELEAVQSGLSQDQRDLLNEYNDPEQVHFERVVRPRLRELGPREVQRRTGHSLGAIHAVLSGSSQPRPGALERYRRAAG